MKQNTRTPNRHYINFDNIDDMISSRNSKLACMFNGLGLDVRLIGDKNQPIIVVKRSTEEFFGVSGYVKNFMYHFTTAPFDGEVIKSVYIMEHDITANDVETMFADNRQRKIYALKSLTFDDMYVSTVDNDLVNFSKTDQMFFQNKASVYSMRNKLVALGHMTTVI